MAVTRTETVPNSGVAQVSPDQGEFLFFTVRAGGPRPRFQFTTDIKGQLLNQGMFPEDPSEVYEWTYLRDPSDIQQFELLTVSLLFAANATYQYVVAVHGPNGHLRDVLDIDYTGASTDFDAETFRVLIV